MNFNDFNWHDAIVKNIKIDRSNPGYSDTITFEIEWPNEKKRSLFTFEDVYWISMNLNFGIVADDCILDAVELDENDKDLMKIYSKWKGTLDEIKLNIYKIFLNSTASEIKIIAKNFIVKIL